jgi:hypothetical protein
MQVKTNALSHEKLGARDPNVVMIPAHLLPPTGRLDQV